MATLGEKIRRIRKELNLNQSDFAKQLGFESPMSINRFEKDKRLPDITTLVKIAELGKVSLDWLLTGEGEMYRQPTPPEVAAPFTGALTKDPRLTDLITKLEYIYKEGTIKERAEVRGIIEEVYDEIVLKPDEKLKEGAA